MEYYSFKTNWKFKMLKPVKPGHVLALKLVLTDQGVRLGHAVNGFNSELSQMTEH